MTSVEEIAVRICISGYSDTILSFVKQYLDIMIECAKLGGFEKTLVDNVMAEKR